MLRILDGFVRGLGMLIPAYVALLQFSPALADTAETDPEVILQRLQTNASAYPLAKYGIQVKVLHSSEQLDQGRELTYELLVDKQRFLFFKTDSRPNQTNMPWSRQCFSYEGHSTRCIAKILEPNNNRSFLGVEKSAAGTLEEIVKQNLIYCEEMFYVSQVGFSNKRLALLGIGLSEKPVYIAMLTGLVQNHSMYQASVAVDADFIRVTIETLPNASLRPKQNFVRHQLVIDPATYRPTEMTMWSAATHDGLNREEAKQRTTTVKWESVRPEKWVPASIRYVETSGKVLSYEELVDVKILRDFADGPPAETEFGWSQFGLEVGDSIEPSNSEEISVWNGTEFTNRLSADVVTNRPLRPNSGVSTGWLYFNLAIVAVLVVVVSWKKMRSAS